MKTTRLRRSKPIKKLKHRLCCLLHQTDQAYSTLQLLGPAVCIVSHRSPNVCMYFFYKQDTHYLDSDEQNTPITLSNANLQ